MSISNTTYQHFIEALNVMNAAIAAHQDSNFFKVFLTGCENVFGDRNLGVAVYQDDPDTPHDYYTIRLEDRAFVLVSHGKKNPKWTWKVSEEYLQQVADDPNRYIKNPALLDWDWFTDRLGIG